MSRQYDGNIAALDAHETADARWLDSRPVCDICGEPIQEEFYYDVDGELYCKKCMDAWLYDMKRCIND